MQTGKKRERKKEKDPLCLSPGLEKRVKEADKIRAAKQRRGKKDTLVRGTRKRSADTLLLVCRAETKGGKKEKGHGGSIVAIFPSRPPDKRKEKKEREEAGRGYLTGVPPP